MTNSETNRPDQTRPNGGGPVTGRPGAGSPETGQPHVESHEAEVEKQPHVPSYRRKSVLFWAMVCVPVVVLLGLASGQLSGSGADDPWFAALEMPAIYPPGWLFGVVWTILYALMGFALALVLASDRKGFKNAALTIFAVQLLVNLAWSPIFFGLHMITFGFIWIVLLIVLVMATIAYFARVSRLAAALMVPYLAWIAFAAVLNMQFMQLN